MDNQEVKIVPPKKVGVILLNIILFIGYWALLQIAFGFVSGILSGMGYISVQTLESEEYYQMPGVINIGIVILLSLAFRKHIYFKLTKKEQKF